MNRSAIALISAFTVSGSTAAVAQPSPAQVQAALASVFRVKSTNCRVGQRPKPDHVASGFAVDLDGTTRLVTALHAVAGCTSWAIEYGGQDRAATVSKVYLTTDLALLDVPGLVVPPLRLATTVPQPGTKLVALGFGVTGTANSNEMPVRMAGAANISGLVLSSRVILGLQNQRFPSTTEPFINLQGQLQRGDSGAPLLDDTGAVAGVANGHLMAGTIPFSWAFPAVSIRQLLSSNDVMPAATSLSDVLAAEDIPTAIPTWGSSIPQQFVTCGARTFRYVGPQTFARLLATADPFALTHIGIVQNYAQANGTTIPPNAAFDVYVEPVSGADFAVPAGFRFTPQGSDCVGFDSAGQLEIRITTDAVPTFPMTTPPIMAFTRRILRSGEFSSDNTQFSTLPVQRPNDGMMIQRYAFFYQLPEQVMMRQATEGYLTFAYRNGTLIEASVRSLVPMIARLGNQTWFPALVGLYATTFAL